MSFKCDFINFSDSLGREYFIKGNDFIFNEGRIAFNISDKEIVADIQPEIISNYRCHFDKYIVLHKDLWSLKGDIIRNRIKAILSPDKSIYARKCIIKKISADISSSFLDNNHLLGNTYAKFKYGMYHEDILVAVATFSKPRPINRDGKIVKSYEWVRYSSLGSNRIAGGMGKFLKHFYNEVDPDEIMSYADIDWSEGDVYYKLGFKLIGKTNPLRFYVNNKTGERVKMASKTHLNESDYKLSSDWQILYNSGNLKFLWSRV